MFFDKYQSKKDGVIRGYDIRSVKVKVLAIIIMVICMILVAVCLFPAIWVFLTSFKDIKEFTRNVTILPDKFDWSRMAESWFWLIDEYEAGLPPEETLARLKQIQQAMAREDWAQSVGDLLQSCMDNLREVTLRSQVSSDMLNDCLKNQDFEGFFALESAAADAFLWDAAREKKYSAILAECLRVWREAEDAEKSSAEAGNVLCSDE